MNNYQKADTIQLVRSGNDFFEQLKSIIEDAVEVIHMQVYILQNDNTGDSILNSLYNAASRGVRVILLADAYGSKSLTKKKINEIRNAGISFRLFSPFFSSESIYMGRRMHHKIVVVDKNTALVGGLNIADKYYGTANEPPWLDFAVLIKGNVCKQLHILCEQLFAKKTRIRSRDGNGQKNSSGNIPIRFLRNDWVRGKNEIHKNYIRAIRSSERSVVLVASYFLPGYTLRKALKRARARGVDITIILAGKSDMPFLWYAEKYLYLFFIRNGIKILEWKNSVLHAKAAIVDEEWVTIGSYNLNPISQYRSIELNVAINDKTFAQQFSNHIKEVVQNNCTLVDKNNDLQAQTLFGKIRNSALYYFFKLIFLIFISKRR